MPHAGPIALTAPDFDSERRDATAGRSEVRSESGPREDLRWREWAARAAGGDRQAFGALVEAWQERLYRFLLRMTRHPQDAEDLAQDTFIKAYLALRRGPVPDSFSAWLFTIARRTALNHRRDQRPWEPLDSAATEAAEDNPAVAEGLRDSGDYVWRLARRLPPRHFEALWLRYAEGFSVAEIARITGATQIGVKVILHRARRTLATWLKKEDALRLRH
ncbi:MAG: sigma-70 family RNA polymerase sigma factor [Verrucomicrobia bacterium]|nr:sigma-70 family RNA polymerase sigma factor [Verrucomicrobiota bacterium]